ncbi:peptide chain release factor 1 [Segatella oris]|uniref:peptide chain release factor 1 n=1 Tax=Segatella oris TaxID=28135 RepID=UPI0028EF27E3|nr:peptide chain release factor 1 [Segatella oris]
MKENVKEQLEKFVQDFRELRPLLQKKYPSSGVIMLPWYEYPKSSTYTKWLERTKRFLNINFPNDKYVDNFEKVSKEELTPEQQEELLAILEAFLEFPDIVSKTSATASKSTRNININTNINNKNIQSQQQSQQQGIEILIRALEDQLSVSQLKEIRQVVEEAKGDLVKAKPKLIDKIKSFGENVASNILANIITNPTIWALLG